LLQRHRDNQLVAIFDKELAMQRNDNILSRFAEVLENIAKVDRAVVTRDKKLRDELGIDSLSLIDVAVASEDEFGVRIPDDDLERFQTVGDLVDYVQQVRVEA
jgi:acyl carrier protein